MAGQVALSVVKGLHSYIEESIMFAKTFRLRVCSVCQYLLLWQRAMRSSQRSLWSIISDNLCGNRRSACGSKLLPSNCSSADPTHISLQGDEVAPFSAARQSGIHATSTVFTARAFVRGCAALRVMFAIIAGATAAESTPTNSFRLATFSADVTVPIGHGMMGGAWLSKRIADSLEAHGFVLLGPGRPMVFVSVDWCEIRNEAYRRWQEALAEAAATAPERVMVATVHQHDAPVADLEAERLLRDRGLKGTVCDPEFHEVAVKRVADALRDALRKAQPVTHFGFGQAQVECVASNRRYIAPDGSVRFDRASRTTDIYAREAPEGLVDPWLKTVSFWNNDVPLLALSGYATHPMSYYGEGEVSADFPGIARRRRQTDTPGTAQIYFTGCGGNITAGKYNAGNRENRPVLADRLYQAMVKAWQGTRRFPLENVEFRTAPVRFEPRTDVGFSIGELEGKLTPETDPFKQCLAAMGLSWRRRLERRPDIEVPCLDLGAVKLLLLPGESYVEFQLAAQQMRSDSHVLVAAYGDGAPGYIPTARHWTEGDGNLRDWCWVAPGADAKLLGAIRRALGTSTHAAVPWDVNVPIAFCKKELYKPHPRPGAAALVSVRYVGPGLERLETHGVEFRDDVHSERFTRLSMDNGKTWAPSRPLASTDVYYDGKEVWEGGGAEVFDPASGLLVGVWLRQIKVNGIYNCFTYTRVSRDHGQTWSEPVQLKYEPGPDFDPKNPWDEAFLRPNQAYFGNNILRHSNGTLVHCVAHANAEGDNRNHLRPWKMGSLCFVGRWDAATGRYNWRPGKRVEISPDSSARGLMEPEVAELKDGRVLVVWRGSTTGWDGTRAKIPGRKFFSVSNDGGITLSAPQEWQYDDGTGFYSPSSYHRMIRHSVTKKLYWIGNISRTPPDGNSPRYPLVIAEVDEEKVALKKDTVTVIDDRKPDQPTALQLSNFSLLEDRISHDLELYLTLYGEWPDSPYTADCYRYTVDVRN